MIRAPETRVLNIAIFEGCTAMGAMPAEQAKLAVAVAEQNEVFAEDLQRLRNIA
jgi:hypothetical protein